MTTHIVLLAAGSSSRMGSSKQLLQVTGEPMLVAAVRTALAASPYVTVVLGHRAAELSKLLEDFLVHAEEHTEWKKGMGSSLKAGIQAVQSSVPLADAVLVTLCDQPKVTSAHLQQLIQLAGTSAKKIIASSYNGTLGVPALFKRDLFMSLMDIADDAGASKLIRQHANDTEAIRFEGAGVDLDTPGDVDRFIGQGKIPQ